jgi:hypothetical protein
MLTLLARGQLADAQSAGDVRRIGYLSNTTLAGNRVLREAFVEGLRISMGRRQARPAARSCRGVDSVAG